MLVYRMFHNILAKHDECVLQVIWIKKCLQNYTLFWHNCRVTCQLNVSQYKKSLQLTFIIIIIILNTYNNKEVSKDYSNQQHLYLWLLVTNMLLLVYHCVTPLTPYNPTERNLMGLSLVTEQTKSPLHLFLCIFLLTII
jgi:membrane-associated HD superfamily phosphohydrolase